MADSERETFEAWVRKDTGMPDWARFNWQAEWVKAALEGWMARAALASRPAEVGGSPVDEACARVRRAEAELKAARKALMDVMTTAARTDE